MHASLRHGRNPPRRPAPLAAGLLALLVASLPACAPQAASVDRPAEPQRPPPGSFVARESRVRELREPQLAGAAPADWFLADPAVSRLEGSSTLRAIQEHPLPWGAEPVIVAVLDSGIDVAHPLLQGKLWTNAKEAEGRPGVDDDGDGLIDDVHGWNFAGNARGGNLTRSNLELARLHYRLLGCGTPECRAVHAAYDEELAACRKYERAVEKTLAWLESQPGRERDAAAKREYLQETRAENAFLYDPSFEPSRFIGDDPTRLDDGAYGNPDLLGGDGRHGTHVAGIIAQQADHVRIMGLRIVPGGDERDKDVARAIRYAVDHGARVINMSLGRYFSMHPEWVGAAVRYAGEHEVVITHSAGNEGVDVDARPMFPRRAPGVDNWLEVGYSGPRAGADLAAGLSNYGRSRVDLFAQGVDIRSSVPGGEYQRNIGSSMAAPQVAGVAALILARHPELTARQVRDVILGSARKYPGLLVKRPQPVGIQAPAALVPFETLSASGGVLDAAAALDAAERVAAMPPLPPGVSPSTIPAGR